MATCLIGRNTRKIDSFLKVQNFRVSKDVRRYSQVTNLKHCYMRKLIRICDIHNNVSRFGRHQESTLEVEWHNGK